MLRHDGREVPLAGGPACRASLGEWPLRASSSIVQRLVRLGATELELDLTVCVTLNIAGIRLVAVVCNAGARVDLKDESPKRYKN